MTADAVQLAVMQCLAERRADPVLVAAVRRAIRDALKSYTGGTLCAAQPPRADRVMSAIPSPTLPGPTPRQLFQPVTAQAARLRKHGEAK